MDVPSPTADRILDCAQSLIVAGGYNGFSYADIADQVGIRKASIHHHYATKDELVRLLVQRYRLAAETGLALLDQHVPDPLQRLDAYLGYWRQCITDQSAPLCMCALLASEVPVLPEAVALEVRAYFKTLSAWLASTLASGADAKRLRLTRSPHIEAEAFMASVHGAMLAARAYGDPAAFALVTETLLDRLALPSRAR